MAARLSAERRAAALQALGGWQRGRGRDAIAQTFIFADFSEAFGFMTRAALVAEKMDHHPEWTNVYKTVEVTLSTHNAGGVTEPDITLAAAMDRIAGSEARKSHVARGRTPFSIRRGVRRGECDDRRQVW